MHRRQTNRFAVVAHRKLVFFILNSRVAKCCIATGDINSARQAIEAALAIEPNNGAVASEMNSLKVLVKHHGDAQNAFNNGDHRKVDVGSMNLSIWLYV
jgi:Tfp pilus assembly protein PilF